MCVGGGDVVMTLGCAFVLMLADGAKPCTCANNLQDSRDGEDKQTHRGAASVCVSHLFSSSECFAVIVIWRKKRGEEKYATDDEGGTAEKVSLKVAKKRNVRERELGRGGGWWMEYFMCLGMMSKSLML